MDLDPQCGFGGCPAQLRSLHYLFEIEGGGRGRLGQKLQPVPLLPAGQTLNPPPCLFRSPSCPSPLQGFRMIKLVRGARNSTCFVEYEDIGSAISMHDVNQVGDEQEGYSSM